MYAVIRTGGKQYRVADGQTVKVESLEGDVGSQLTLGEVLSISDGATVKIFKMRRRKHYQHRAGHRQNFTELRIDSIG